MTEPADPRHPVEALADEFAARCRRGEAPSIGEYADRHPDLADEIRALFPAVAALERCGAGRPREEPPTRLGEFRILREVGRGGMGVVYEAVQESLGRRVALKVLPTELARPDGQLPRFRREAAAAARLHHTNIVPVFGLGEADGVHFYTMQFIEGRPLSRLPRGAGGTVAAGQDTKDRADSDGATPVPVAAGGAASTSDGPAWFRFVARVGQQAGEALACAHAQGVLHRDVKPANLLVDDRGTVWVADFGLAKADGSDDLTATGDVVGTLRYLAPERLRG
jgi:serine/threonine protein kinase